MSTMTEILPINPSENLFPEFSDSPRKDPTYLIKMQNDIMHYMFKFKKHDEPLHKLLEMFPHFFPNKNKDQSIPEVSKYKRGTEYIMDSLKLFKKFDLLTFLEKMEAFLKHCLTYFIKVATSDQPVTYFKTIFDMFFVSSRVIFSIPVHRDDRACVDIEMGITISEYLIHWRHKFHSLPQSTKEKYEKKIQDVFYIMYPKGFNAPFTRQDKKLITMGIITGILAFIFMIYAGATAYRNKQLRC